MYFVEKTKGINFWKQFDYTIFILVLLITSFGLIVLSSATKTMPSGNSIMLKQIIGIVLGIAVALIINTIDYNDLKTLGILYYIFCIFLLIAVLFIGTGDKLGNKNWINLGPINVQPSELTKVAFIIIISLFLERIKEGTSDQKNVLKLVIYAMLPILLVIAEKDVGTTMVFVFIFFVMLFICGLPYKLIFTLLSVCTASLPFIWKFALNDVRRKRILVFLNPDLEPLGAGMNVIRSKLAVGSGQIFGKGLFNGLQTQTGGVPVRESDFIFSVIGEELGFIGCIIIVLLFFSLLIRFIYVAKNSRDSFGGFLVIGVTAMFAFHIIENIGMSIGLLPVTGIPLPFVSAGSTSLVTNYIAVGIILSVSMRRKKAIFNSTE
ncbi:MAG: rod shape-determining protein RodA [Clostridiales bacterium]|nr:rod shape-determining protein RodA [Clostridiales bacterium]